MEDIRMNFSDEVEGLINKQINMELYASYVYMAMGRWFARHDLALHGFAGFFKRNSEEEREHADMLMEYQTKRGGTILYKDIKAPKNSYDSPLKALEDALALERKVNDSLLLLQAKSDEVRDPHFANFLDKFLDEQVNSIAELGDLICKTKRAGDGLGQFTIDQHLLQKADK